MIDGERWRRVERVLDAVLAHEPAEWPALLDETCVDDLELRAEVEAYLRRLDDARDFLATPPAAVAAALVAEAGTLTAGHEGRRVGAYRIVREIGRGGMSRVFLAERDDGAFTQTVAVKLLRAGLDSDADQHRFRVERQVLATLSHPHIARLLDGGVTDDGLLYLVLEYVDGEPIDRYCARHALSVRARLQLFLDVAEATQYAHRSLIVHRDLKPSNILVTADGDVKLLDFGLAKLLQAEDSAATTPQTRVGHRLMTPEYAAPEQLRGEPITTLTDVYQLGAVLYELLTGRRPFVARAGSLRELEHAVTTIDPPPPSAAANALTEHAGGQPRTADTAAATRRALRGDLDAIVLQALRKEPDQRYASAEALADDVRRHLAGRPVLARGPAPAYRARRFVRRHRFSLATAVVIAGLIGAWVGTVIVSRARIQGALEQALLGARKSEQVTDFMLGLFEADPTGTVLSDTVTARALLNRGLARARAASGQPELHAQMLNVIGRIHTQLGDVRAARPLLEEALALERGLHGTAHADVVTTLVNLAAAHDMAQDVGSAVPLRREALALRRSLGGEDDPTTLDALFDLGSALHRAGEIDEAEPLFERWLTAIERQPSRITPERAQQLSAAADMLELRGQYERAQRIHRQVLDTRRALYGDRHPAVAHALIQLALPTSATAPAGDAEALMLEALDILRASYPQGHPDLASALRSWSMILQRQQRDREAEPPLREALAMTRRLAGEDALYSGTYGLDLAHLLNVNGEYEEAESHARDGLRILLRQFGDGSAMTARARVHLGDALRGQGRLTEAEPLLLSAWERLRNTGMEWRFYAIGALARYYDAADRPAEAARFRAMLPARP